MYAIIDIETTGGSPKREKITEIAIYIHNGESLVKEFITLINPEKIIPHFITQLTGITNEMVADSPKFYEIAKNVVELTENKIIVAHNVNFDYSFIKNEFERLGYEYERERICTVKLSRKLVPGKNSYSLGKLCYDLGININGRHRAAGDAMATVKLFEYLNCINGEKLESDNFKYKNIYDNLHPSFDANKIKTIPEKPGIYYLHNENADILYIGKSINIKNRVISHFQNNQSRRAIEMKSQIVDISYELTGNELIALLMESAEIKKHKPKYNRAQRKTYNHYGLYSFIDNNGYINLKIEKNSLINKKPITCFNNQLNAKRCLENLIKEYNLCQKLCGLYKSKGACFHYQIGECSGACIGSEPNHHYNSRVLQAINEFKLENKNYLIIDKGRYLSENSVVKIENGKYIGFGYFDNENVGNNIEILHDCIKKYQDNHDVQSILKKYLNKNKVETIITF